MLRGSIPPTGLPASKLSLILLVLSKFAHSLNAQFFLSPSKHSLCGVPENSAGSTSLFVFMSAIGVVLNVDCQSRKSEF